VAEPATADPAGVAVDSADAERACAHVAEKAEQARGRGADVLERLQAQLASVSERVFGLATRGLGAPAPAEDVRVAGSSGEEGEAAALAQMASLERHVDRLATGVSALHSAESELLREVQPQLAFFIATAERVIERAGMDLDDVFQERTKPRRTAEGGPFIAAISGPLAAERAALQSDLAYWQALRALVKRMPLAAPLDRYAISSSYGTRRDPLNNRQAMHHGIDLIAAANAPIRAPAPGIVVFAGRNGGYGNMVEIDHGRSLRTRYAHLRTIKVKAGEKVEFEQKLGTLGNSGRSTGAHLHYEILIAGKPADPLSFIKAGQHVFQE
jgi:murein DD-endopeptidase MepM/ murein hydrolase activator NlpD